MEELLACAPVATDAREKMIQILASCTALHGEKPHVRFLLSGLARRRIWRREYLAGEGIL